MAKDNERIRRLKREQGELFTEMQALRNKLEAEKRSAFTSEEQEKWDRLNDRFDEIQSERDREDQLEQRAAQIAVGDDDDANRPVPGASDGKPKNIRATPEYEKRFTDFIFNGRSAIPESERRAMQMDSDIGGGYLIASEQWVNELIKNVDDQVFIRNLARKFPVPDAKSLGVPNLESDANDAEWTSEIKTGSEDDGPEFGKRSLEPHPVAKRIKISEPLLRRIGESLVRERLAYKFAVTEEKAFLTGDGVGKPLGVFTASNDGIPTSRDVSADNSATAMTADGLINVVFSLKAQYLQNAVWVFHRDAVKQIRKLKYSGTGEYVWTPGIQNGKGQAIFDRPFYMSEYCPNTFTTGKYVGILGDFSRYWIADALDMKLQRLIELYAETNQVGFIGRKETDGAPVLAEAFTRVKLG